jgi:hypothetical protein
MRVPKKTSDVKERYVIPTYGARMLEIYVAWELTCPTAIEDQDRISV